MGFFIKKKEKVITDVTTKEVDGVEVWVVKWYRRYGDFSDDREVAAKAFLNEKDAQIFAQSLSEAKKLLQDTDNIAIKIKKQI